MTLDYFLSLYFIVPAIVIFPVLLIETMVFIINFLTENE